MEPHDEFKPKETPEAEGFVPEEPEAESFIQEDKPLIIENVPAEEVVAEPLHEGEPEPVAAAVPEVKPEVKREPLRAPRTNNGLWNKALPWVIVALVFFLGGLATIYFAMYRPLKQAAALTSEETALETTNLNDQISQLTLDKSQLATELQTTRDELVNTQADLATANATIEEQIAEVANANVQNMVYSMLTNVNIARAALETNDASSARQALTFAKGDLVELEGSGIEADVLSGFAERLDEATTNLSEEGFATSRAALETLFNNLLLLAKNLP